MMDASFSQAAFEFNSNGLLIIDKELKVVGLNQTACSLLNIEQDQIIGIFLGNKLSPMLKYMEQTLYEEKEFDFAPYLYFNDGRPRLLRLQTRRLLDPRSELIGGMAIISEPTDILEMASTVCDSLPIAGFIFDYKEQMVHMNTAAVKLFGYEEPEFKQMTAEQILKIIINPNIKARPAVRYVLQSGLPSRQVRDKFYTKDGQSLGIVADIFPLMDTFGTPVGAQVIMRKVEEEFVSFQGTAKFLLDIMPETILAVDNQLVVVVYNQMAEELFKVQRINAINLKVEKLKSQVDADRLPILEGLITGSDSINQPLTITTQGATREFLLDVRRVTDENGSYLGAIAVVREVTALREMDRAVQKSARLSMIGELAAGMAHEIRNPLTAVRGFLQLLQSRAARESLPEVNEYSDIMLTELDRVNELISQFLMLGQSRPEKKMPLQLDRLLDDLCLLFENESIMREIGLKRVNGSVLPELEGDPEQLKQVFTNLFTNALQAMDEGGQLTIESLYDRRSHQVVVRFIDTGHGMDQEVLAKVFDPFFTTRDNGTGLGLAISHQIIDAHGGTINVLSEVGRGCTVEVLLPITRFV
ncbi:MAG: PAS domain-containing protein [Firmicutes bacterium]|nr:PAS domain-containing protein [Bacillota bacterium]